MQNSNSSIRVLSVFGLLGFGLITTVSGCSADRSPESGNDTQTTQPEVSTTDGSADSVTAETPTKPSEAGEIAGESTTSQPADNSKVMLGSPDLTAGIPGTGPLTVDQVKTWLADLANHVELDIQLPLGLSLGMAQVQGLSNNPLTKAKIELGRQLYFDKRLSVDHSVSCASCHDPAEGFGRHTQFGVGIEGQTGDRNSPVSYNRILSGAQFWDGRAASLEDQAKGPIANPIEMGNTHEAAVKSVAGLDAYRLQFDAVFGGEGLSIDTIAKAIASFERAIVTGPSAYDYYEALKPFRSLEPEDIEDLKESDPQTFQKYQAYLSGTKAQPMSESMVRGRDLFFSKEVNCAACHVGANLSDEKYHNLGVGMNKDPAKHLGRFSVTKDEKERGAFKTPTIRNVALSAPYMHDGSQKTLEQVVEHYNKGGIPNKSLSDKIKKLNLKDQDKQDLVAFMKACTGEFPKVATGRLP